MSYPDRGFIEKHLIVNFLEIKVQRGVEEIVNYREQEYDNEEDFQVLVY